MITVNDTRIVFFIDNLRKYLLKNGTAQQLDEFDAIVKNYDKLPDTYVIPDLKEIDKHSATGMIISALFIMLFTAIGFVWTFKTLLEYFI